MLAILHDSIKQTHIYYEQNAFCRVISELTALVMNISNFYFETAKDRLYADPVNSITRRSAQTVFFNVFNF